MTVRLIKNSWWVDFRFDYKRYRKRSPQNSRASALAYEASLRHRLARGEDVNEREENRENFQEFAERWMQTYVIPNNKSSERYEKQRVLKHSINPFFGKMLLGSIGTEHIERFKARQKLAGASNKTINNKLTILSKCLKCAEEWGGTKMPKIKLLRCPTPKTDCLTSQECEVLLKHADRELHEMLLLALRTGMRQAEIRGLQWSSIDWQNVTVTVRHAQYDRDKCLVTTKNNRERIIPLDGDVYDLLAARRKDVGYVFVSSGKNTPYTSHKILYELEKICKKSSTRRIGWHALRHTFATHLIMRGVPITVVKELLGHSSITTTMRYSHVAPVALRAAIDALSSRAPIADFGQPVGNA